ncbi:Dihydroceramide fatty acyl 2-hydroxylase FAH1 [Rhynchospora pubera]|uniref:Dihydroceramide fatty acyl 2-hydroxylase FAH1 n=1 Tax=Rhynchospora pubera TaxID=906938 RepID=A0AAV8DXN3_9POAL|nr:Dihydroceramide fatty acyl 2-hydroxylase FAH1 [Rhynchospora pubera]
MPSPSSKKTRAGSALARFISSLRPDRQSGSPGSLPLQTGFPTSLADLYVKNQSRLKKPNKKTKKKRRTTNSESVSTVGSSPDVADSPTSPVLSSSGNDGEVVEEEETISSVPDDVSVCERRSSLGIGFVVIVNILVLVLLAIFGKKLVVGLTSLAFFSWFLDSVRIDLVRFFKPCVEMRRNLSLEERSFELVSPIREVEIETESDLIELEIRDESTELDEIVEESSEFCETQTGISKKKSILKRLFSKKKRKAQEKSGSLDDSVKGKEMDTVSISEKAEDDIVNLATEEIHEVPVAQIKQRERSQSWEIEGGVSWLVVFSMVIMFGLIEGKVVALLLTIFCFVSLSLLELARRNERNERIRLGL